MKPYWQMPHNSNASGNKTKANSTRAEPDSRLGVILRLGRLRLPITTWLRPVTVPQFLSGVHHVRDYLMMVVACKGMWLLETFEPRTTHGMINRRL